MTTQTSTPPGIPPGLGLRLKEERKRLGLNQVELAQIGGVGRLAQLQYESEASAPTTRYLSAIGAAGVDLVYLISASKAYTGELRSEQQDRVERRAFEWVEMCAEAEPDGHLSAESRRVLFRMIRDVLIQMELGTLPENFDTSLLMSQQMKAHGKR
ncbi:XRE family transcriptional regulator [Noviherbaspirillum cavernae]|uniref:XRE family transcriptional regulator n=1 Tax=Noviherbaspirillum cavernae TaxID=2320862 RepID=A0A418WYE1_9BURK|nr:helix-turn-helix transcriptional regulator [Noviherbaspirillum cavernae]RJG05264.1 XRE family transcriptional regulator [Noviherbaspirillum cavernae]